jgi:cysteine desulfurase
MIYLDYNATTPVDRAVLDAMFPYFSERFGNPSSSHAVGREARAAVEQAREDVAAMIGAAPDEIVFTSGATEANNLAVFGSTLMRGGGHVITTAIEHPAIAAPCARLEAAGFRVTRLPVGRDCRVDPGELAAAITNDTVLVTVMHSDNETGALQPVAEIGRILNGRGIAFHTDAAQSPGKADINVNALGVDFMSLAGHKFYAPKGIGALFIRRGAQLRPLMFGAGHERGIRPGTENVPLIVGLGAACRMAAGGAYAGRMRELSAMLLARLKAIFPDARINGSADMRLPNTLNVCLPGVNVHALLDRLTDRLAASAGAACHGAGGAPSGVLKAMGLSDADALSSIRLSVGKDTAYGEIDEAARLMAEASGVSIA